MYTSSHLDRYLGVGGVDGAEGDDAAATPGHHVDVAHGGPVGVVTLGPAAAGVVAGWRGGAIYELGN